MRKKPIKFTQTSKASLLLTPNKSLADLCHTCIACWLKSPPLAQQLIRACLLAKLFISCKHTSSTELVVSSQWSKSWFPLVTEDEALAAIERMVSLPMPLLTCSKAFNNTCWKIKKYRSWAKRSKYTVDYPRPLFITCEATSSIAKTCALDAPQSPAVFQV